MRMRIKFTRLNEIEAKYEKLRVDVKVKRGLTFTFTRDFQYFALSLFYLPA